MWSLLQIAGKVPVSILPDLMHAAGYYPSQADIASLLAHVKFLTDTAPADDDDGLIGADTATATSTSDSGGHSSSTGGSKLHAAVAGTASHVAGQPEVDFETFLCLYVNHRPVAGVDQQQIEQAFQKLGNDTSSGGSQADAGPTRCDHTVITVI